MQTACGHLFCRGCLEPVLEGPNSVCPVDKTSISKDMVSDSVYWLYMNMYIFTDFICFEASCS